MNRDLPATRPVVAFASPALMGCLVSLAVGTGSGCASYNGMPFVDSGTASSVVEHREFDGLHVAVRDLSKPRLSEKHFDRDLGRFGVVPVVLMLELNPDCRDAFNIRRNEIQLVLRDGTRLTGVDPLDVVDEVAFTHWRSIFSYLLIVPGPFVTSSVNAANRELETDYLRKAVRSVRISPNMRTYRGVVFFLVPEEQRDRFTMEDSFVELTVYKEGNRGDGKGIGKRLDFPIHFSE